MSRWVLLSSMTTTFRAGRVSARPRQSCRAASSRSRAPTVVFLAQSQPNQHPAHRLDADDDSSLAFPVGAIPLQLCQRFARHHCSQGGFIASTDARFLSAFDSRRHATRCLIATDVAFDTPRAYPICLGYPILGFALLPGRYYPFSQVFGVSSHGPPRWLTPSS